MNAEHLIKMANQIGAFFDAMPHREQAVKDVAAHIEKNWEARMRAALQDHIARCGDQALSPIVRDAFQLIAKVV